jgi:phage terminase small subunit
MPRRSAADLATPRINTETATLQPPATLPEAERAIFNDLVAACNPKHFRASDLPLLVRYVESCALADQAAQELRKGAVVNGKTNPWIVVQEKSVRAMVALSMRLRLSPQARHDPKTLARQRPPRPGPQLWEDDD